MIKLTLVVSVKRAFGVMCQDGLTSSKYAAVILIYAASSYD